MGVKKFKKDIKVFLAILLFSITLYGTVQWYDSYIYHIYRVDDFLNWHIGLEGLSIVMSFCIFFISFYTMQRNKNLRTTIFLTTFLAVGLPDSMHTLTYKGMPGFLSGFSISTATSFWIAARLTAAVGLTVAALAKRNYTVKFHRFIFVLVSLLYSLIVIYLISYRQDLIPTLYVEGAGLTPLKIILEYVIIVIQVVAMFLYYRIYRTGEEIVEYKYIILSLLFSIFSELAFTQYSSVYDTYNLLGHIYKIIAYYLIFKAKFVLNVQRPYMDLQNAEGKMVEYADGLERQVEIRTKEITAANEKLLNDLDYARNIQTALLPSSFPKADKLQFASRYLPCEKIGGDFYNVFRLDEDNFGILIGDVAGHGVSAAMITVFIDQNIHVRREFDDGRIRILTPKQVLTNLYYTYNRMTFPEEIYTVMFYGIYNQKDMTFTYCSAGMNTVPLILHKNGTVDTISIKGLPICRLGGLVSPSYENQTIQLEDGDSVLLYTDGLIEIDRKRPDQFNEKYLMEYLRGLQNFSASDTVDYMIDLYNTILGENKVIDDVTVLVVKIEEENVLEEVV